MDTLGIDKKEIELIIMRGMKWKEDSREIWHAQMAGIEAIFVKEESNFIVITVYLAGRSK